MSDIIELTEEEASEKIGENIESDKTYYQINKGEKEYYAISNFIPPCQFAIKKQNNNKKIEEIKRKIDTQEKIMQEKSSNLERILNKILTRKNYAENAEENLKFIKELENLQKEIQEIKDEIGIEENKIKQLNKQISDKRSKELEMIDPEEEKKIQIALENGKTISEIRIEKPNNTEILRKDFYSNKVKSEKNLKQTDIQKRVHKPDEKTKEIEREMFPDRITYHYRVVQKNGERIIVTTGYQGEEELYQKKPSGIKILIDNGNQSIQECIITVEEGKYKIMDKNGKGKVINLGAYEKKHNISLQPSIEELNRYKQTDSMNIEEILKQEDVELYTIIKEEEQTKKDTKER